MTAISTEVSVSVVAGFAADGRVYRSFNHLVAAASGALLLVPLGRTTGDLRAVIDACPVPWEELWALIDTLPERPALVAPEAMCADHPRLAQITPYGWVADEISVGNGRPCVRRLLHASGIVFGRAS